MTLSVDGDEKIYCPYCGAISIFYFPFNIRKYYHCPSCDLIFLQRKENIKNHIDYYRESYYDDHTVDQLSGQRSSLYRHILDLLANYKKPGSLLDLGCGCGYFLKEARERGWRISGVDPSEKSIAYARSLIGDTVVCGTLDNIPTGRQFDVITMINVLDHMADAWLQLRKVKALLAPDSVLYLRFPNGLFHSYVVRLSLMLTDTQFMNRFLIFHEYAITSRAIKRCLGDMGFVDIRVLNAHLTGGNFFPSDSAFPSLARNIIKGMTWSFFRSLEKLSGGRWIWGPSLQVIARIESATDSRR